MADKKIEKYPKWLDKAMWRKFVYHRDQLGKPFTPYAEKCAIGKLKRMISTGQSQEKIIQQSIDGAWRGLFDVKQNNKQPDNLNVENKLAAYRPNIPVLPAKSENRMSDVRGALCQKSSK